MSLPRHAAFVMDGNGRWAKARGKPRVYGHLQGARAMREIVRECVRAQLPHATFFAFGVDNWKRDAAETSYIWKLVPRMLTAKAVRDLNARNARFSWIGFRDDARIPAAVSAALRECEQKTAQNTGTKVCLAMNYSGVRDVQRAARAWAQAHFAGDFADHLLTGDAPPVDLLVRTGGESRLSDFLLYQSAYAEIRFVPDLWPDFTPARLHECLEWFSGRQRRFGDAR